MDKKRSLLGSITSASLLTIDSEKKLKISWKITVKNMLTDLIQQQSFNHKYINSKVLTINK